ncbi:MAG: xanthine dehydrogenase family protein molybdopterin-binding subunit [Flavobacteriales bacterium]|jgi:isoquinoline 1-oxidoreductase subunit beta|nr:xanthine dehydrogenase family protein molybdopterin-binding subunit [Flavobacteriales bacterium]
MGTIQNVSRRGFLKGIGLASGGLVIACSFPTSSLAKELMADTSAFNPNLFVQLLPNGDLILLASRSEMGQGIRTSLTSVIADEMEADWERVIIKQATGDAKFGNQNTDGSRSIRTLLEPMRQMGATARAMLISAAAQKWNVPEKECYALNHFIYHKPSAKKIAFGDLVAKAASLEVPTDVPLKDPKDFKYIGKNLPSKDVLDYAQGKAKFGMDIRLPNMKFAAIARCPVTFGTVKSFNSDAAMQIPGVLKVVEIPKIDRPFGPLGGVAVIATNTWAAFLGKEVLEIEWNYGKNKAYNSDAYMKTITAHSQKDALVVIDKGSVSDAFAQADKVIESTYQLPHLVHAPMEVPNATADFNGTKCTIYAPLQDPQTARKEVAVNLGLKEANVTVKVTFLGGGFGRKSKPDFAVEAAILSKAVSNPVQVVWTREDDIQHSYYHSVSAQYLKGAVDAKGNVTGWLHRSTFPSIASTFIKGKDHGMSGEFDMGLINTPYDIENFRCENGQAEAHVRIGWLRSVSNIFHAFASNVFADELAVAAKKDALAFRLKMIGADRVIASNSPYKIDTKRLKNVLNIAAKNAGWGRSLPKNHGMGLAVHYSFYTYVASVVEVSVIDGKLKVHNIHTALDCGRVVNTNTVLSQFEGAAVFGLSLSYYGKITAKDGAIEQDNFDTYKMLRMPDVPKINVEIVESDAVSTGVGEPGVPVIGPALINAIYNATGKRYRSLPLSDFDLV